MENEIFRMSAIISAVLNGADDIRAYAKDDHDVGHYEGYDFYEDYGPWWEFALIDSVLMGIMAGKWTLHLSNRQEKNLNNIIKWLKEDGVIVKLPDPDEY